jgi:hypothetical protein
MTVNPNGRGNSGRGARYRKFGGNAIAPLPGAAAQPPREGACKELGPHVFDFGSHDSADLLTTSWDALKVHVGTKYNEDIKMELENGSETTIPLPKLSEELTRAHEEQWEQQKRRLERILRVKEQAENVARAKLIAATEYIVEIEGREDATVDIGSMEHEVECSMSLTTIQNELDEMRLQLATPPRPKLEGEDKSKYDGEWKTYGHRLAELTRYRGLTYNLLFGQCTQPLKDKMKNDPIYDEVTKSGNPLKLKVLIDMIVMAQTEHQYYCKTIHELEKGLLGFVQGNLTNAQYYEKIGNRISVDKAVGITRIHKVAVQATAKKLFTKRVEDLTEEELHQAEDMAEESYIAYLMIMNSAAQHD